jgi:hypothetical protein
MGFNGWKNNIPKKASSSRLKGQVPPGIALKVGGKFVFISKANACGRLSCKV